MSRTVVPTHVAKTQLSRLVRQACEGEEVVLCRGDVPVARIVPIDPVPARRRNAGALAHLVGGVAPGLDDFSWSDQELDAMLGDVER